jgi:hypothetical protein
VSFTSTSIKLSKTSSYLSNSMFYGELQKIELLSFSTKVDWVKNLFLEPFFIYFKIFFYYIVIVIDPYIVNLIALVTKLRMICLILFLSLNSWIGKLSSTVYLMLSLELEVRKETIFNISSMTSWIENQLSCYWNLSNSNLVKSIISSIRLSIN